MKALILIASLWALVASKPEMYKEKEDFEYSRSSSDDGSKSGFYGAQRGNMGGNYEKAHNMDSLAQHQMSTLVNQVDGELGEGASTRTGSVFSAANSRGIYGSGNYDLSNLRGRNFAEGTSLDDSLSQSAVSKNSAYSRHGGYGSSHSSNTARYSNSHSQSSGYHAANSQYMQTDKQRSADNLYGARNHEYDHQAGNNYRYNSRSGSEARTDYERLNSNNGYDLNTRGSTLYATPVKVYIRPGARVAIPIAAQTYDASHSSLAESQNTISSDAELLDTDAHRQYYRQTNNAKHYESAYRYRKEWEKHDTIPVTVSPTESPLPKNSELFDDAQLSQTAGNNYDSVLNSANARSSNTNSAYLRSYSANTKSAAASESQHQSHTYDSGASATNLHALNSYNAGLAAKLHNSHISDEAANSHNLVENIDSNPKSYHSSYSYHKSWERRGDPYVIKPLAANEPTSQKLTAASASHGYSSNLYDCTYCIEQSQRRQRRSLGREQYQGNQNLDQEQDDLGQQFITGWDLSQQTDDKWNSFGNAGQLTENDWGKLETSQQGPQSQLSKIDDLKKETQNQWENLENLDQQIHSQDNKIEELNEHSQNEWNKLEDLDQNTQNQWNQFDDLSQHSQHHWEQGEDLHQQPQNKWNNSEKSQTQGHSEELDQQSQNVWKPDSDQKTQTQSLEDLSQQTQSQWNQLESFGQETQNQWNQLENEVEDLGQQVQSQWHKLGDVIQEQQNQNQLEDLGQLVQSQWDKLGDLAQESQSQNNLENLGQQTQSQWDQLGDVIQGQLTQSHWDKLGGINQEQQSQNKLEDLGQQIQNQWDKLGVMTQKQQDQKKIEDLGQQTQNEWGKLGDITQEHQSQNNLEDLGQQIQNQWNSHGYQHIHPYPHWNSLENIDKQSVNKWHDLENSGQQIQNNWSKLHSLKQKD